MHRGEGWTARNRRGRCAASRSRRYSSKAALRGDDLPYSPPALDRDAQACCLGHSDAGRHGGRSSIAAVAYGVPLSLQKRSLPSLPSLHSLTEWSPHPHPHPLPVRTGVKGDRCTGHIGNRLLAIPKINLVDTLMAEQDVKNSVDLRGLESDWIAGEGAADPELPPVHVRHAALLHLAHQQLRRVLDGRHLLGKGTQTRLIVHGGRVQVQRLVRPLEV